MTNKEILNQYKPLVAFISSIMGPGCEVLLHDVSDPENSVIEISNGFHSGRDIGYPMTDFSTKIIESGEYKTKDYISNYAGTGKGKKFISSTFFIKNRAKLIGLLCVNRDISSLVNIESAFVLLKNQFNLITEPATQSIQESLDAPVTEIIFQMVQEAIKETGIIPERMSIHEKVAVVHKLKEQGVLQMKGAVSEIATQLKISEPTVYRYIKKEVS